MDHQKLQEDEKLFVSTQSVTVTQKVDSKWVIYKCSIYESKSSVFSVQQGREIIRLIAGTEDNTVKVPVNYLKVPLSLYTVLPEWGSALAEKNL